MMRIAHQTAALRGWLALALAMLAIVFQALVLAPHVHAAGPAEQAGYALPHSDDAPEALAACAFCRHGASSRLFTTAPDIVLTAPLADTERTSPHFADQSITRPPSLAWRSRAPPLELC